VDYWIKLYGEIVSNYRKTTQAAITRLVGSHYGCDSWTQRSNKYSPALNNPKVGFIFRIKQSNARKRGKGDLRSKWLVRYFKLPLEVENVKFLLRIGLQRDKINRLIPIEGYNYMPIKGRL